MKIPFLDLRAAYLTRKPEIYAAVASGFAMHLVMRARRSIN